MIIQEDKAPAHNSKHQTSIWMSTRIFRLLWPGNSPDLNMIEPTWPYLKRKTTEKGPPTSGKDTRVRWQAAWKALPQDKIQAWIERIPRHIQKFIELEDGNKYLEGRTGLNKRTKEGKAKIAELHKEFARAVPVTKGIDLFAEASNPEEN